MTRPHALVILSVFLFAACNTPLTHVPPPPGGTTNDQDALNAIFKSRVSITQDVIDVKSLAGSVLYPVTFQGQSIYAFDSLVTNEDQIKVASQSNKPFDCTYDNTTSFTGSLSYYITLSGSLSSEDKATATFADVFTATGPSLTPGVQAAIQAWKKTHSSVANQAFYITSARLSTLTTTVYHNTSVSGALSAPILNFGGKNNYVRSRSSVVACISVDLSALPGAATLAPARSSLAGTVLRVRAPHAR
jgi:hypothetical protein